jgi:hypothetical protein
MKENLAAVKLLARDLRDGKEYLRSPRTTMAGYVIARVRLSELSVRLQEYMEDYIAKFVPCNRVVYTWFDVYDLEEERL